MATTKIHIDIKLGVIDAEGSEEFVAMIYRDFKERMALVTATASHSAESLESVNQKEELQGGAAVPKRQESSGAKRQAVSKQKSKGGAVEASLIKDLDLTGGAKHQSLRDFCAKYLIKTNLERNLIFTYYLRNIIGAQDVGINHIFTCYRSIPGTKIPGNLKQSLYDTSARGWISVKSIESDISVPVMGINHIEHDLPKSEAG